MGRTADDKLMVIVLIDALGWEIVERFSFCKRVLPVAGPLETVLGYSSAAIPSLLSGQPPERHGSWAMYKYDPSRSPFRFLRHLPRLPHALEWRMRLLTRWLVDKRRAINGYYDLYEIPLDVLGSFDVAQRGDPYTPGGLSEETFFDRLVAEQIPYKLWTYRTPESQNFEELLSAVDTDNRVLFLYTADLDALMHVVGIFHDDVKRKLAGYERQIEAVLDRAEKAGRQVTLHLFSDHGMTDVQQSVDLMGEVEKWGYRLGRDVTAFYDSTMARFWCAPHIKNDLIRRLDATGWGRVVTDAELEAFGCRFDDRSYGEVIFLVSPGALIVPSYMGKKAIRAMHGYHPDDRFSKGCFMTNDGSQRPPASIMELKDYLLSGIRGES